MPDFNSLETSITAWAAGQDAVRAAVIVGSHARRGDQHPADELSDLDVALFVTDHRAFTSDDVWLRQFGTIWVHIDEATGDNDPEYLIIYEGARKVDIVFWMVDELRAMVDKGHLNDVMNRGYRVVLDKDGLLAKLPAPDYRTRIADRPPTQAEFDDITRRYWYALYQTGRYLKRRDLWLVKYSEHRSRAELITMIEWYTRVMHGADHDIWHAGRFITEWVSDDVRAALPTLFTPFHVGEAWRGVTASTRLFGKIARSVAAHFGLTYLEDIEKHIGGFVYALYEQAEKEGFNPPTGSSA